MEQKGFGGGNGFGRAPKNNNVVGGLVLVLVGVVILLKKLPGTQALIPGWLFSWPALLIVIGLSVGITHRFRGLGWLVLIVIGGYFMLQAAGFFTFDLRPFALPIALIAIGISVMVKRNRSRRCRAYARQRWREHVRDIKITPDVTPPDPFAQQDAAANGNAEDFINVNCVFSSVEKMVLSKGFKGGKINCLFGGTEVNMSQADFDGAVVLNVSISFGGAEITIPANWQVQNEVSVVLGGLDDKRRILPTTTEPVKTLVLRGNVLCGGIEIRS